MWLPKVLKDNESKDSLVLTGSALCEAAKSLHRIACSKEFPMRQLYKFVHAWRKGQTDEAAAARKRLLDSPVKQEIEQAVTSLGGEIGYLHLLQMLPYIPQEVSL
jgi:hypothetical protein